MNEELIMLENQYAAMFGSEPFNVAMAFPDYWFDDERVELKIQTLKLALAFKCKIIETKLGQEFAYTY